MKHPPLCSKRLQVSITMNREDYKIMAILAVVTSIPILISTSQFSGTGSDNPDDHHQGSCISGNCEDGFGIYEYTDKSKYVGNFKSNEPINNEGDLWLFVSDEFRQGEETFYLKANSAEHEDGFIYLEDMSDFRAEFYPFGARSITNYVEINCNDSSSRPLQAKMYSKSLAQGTVLSKLSESDLIFEYVNFTESERGYVYSSICELFKDNQNNKIYDSIFSREYNQDFSENTQSSYIE